MRSVFLITGVCVVFGGCSNYVTEKQLPTGCVEQTFYLDADQDGWGSMEAESKESCTPILEENYTARNPLDCDDSTNLVTGKVGSVCPQNVVAGDNKYAGQVIGNREYVAIVGSTLSGSESAVGSCGQVGWGGRWDESVQGGLAVFPNMQGMFRVINQIDELLKSDGTEQSQYAAWVGVEYKDGAWTFSRDSGDFEPSDMGFCGGTVPDPDAFNGGPAQLALVRKFGSGDWCFGRPSDANPDSPETGSLVYTNWSANFICERPRPDARCHVAKDESPWLQPCSCRVAKGENLDDLQPSEDPESMLGADLGRYESEFDSKLCLAE